MGHDLFRVADRRLVSCLRMPPFLIVAGRALIEDSADVEAVHRSAMSRFSVLNWRESASTSGVDTGWAGAALPLPLERKKRRPFVNLPSGPRTGHASGTDRVYAYPLRDASEENVNDSAAFSSSRPGARGGKQATSG
jgi:hypothetical protein